MLDLTTYPMAFFMAKFFKKKKPLFISWAITDRCNFSCQYCNVANKGYPDIATARILKLIDEMSLSGTKRILFTGGEPLLRDDIGEILSYCRSKHIAPGIITNGALVKKRINALRNASRVSISLDGPEHIHDSIRGRGAFSNALIGMAILQKTGIKFTIHATLSSLNYLQIDALIAIAEQYRARILFQPATSKNLGSSELNPICLSSQQSKEVILNLLRKKRQGEKIILNSSAGLRHLFNWPDPKKISCICSYISCHIDADGTVRSCSRRYKDRKDCNCYADGFARTFYEVKPYSSCEDCWVSSRIELNLCSSFNLNSLLNIRELSS